MRIVRRVLIRIDTPDPRFHRQKMAGEHDEGARSAVRDLALEIAAYLNTTTRTAVASEPFATLSRAAPRYHCTVNVDLLEPDDFRECSICRSRHGMEILHACE